MYLLSNPNNVVLICYDLNLVNIDLMKILLI